MLVTINKADKSSVLMMLPCSLLGDLCTLQSDCRPPTPPPCSCGMSCIQTEQLIQYQLQRTLWSWTPPDFGLFPTCCSWSHIPIKPVISWRITISFSFPLCTRVGSYMCRVPFYCSAFSHFLSFDWFSCLHSSALRLCRRGTFKQIKMKQSFQQCVCTLFFSHWETYDHF